MLEGLIDDRRGAHWRASTSIYEASVSRPPLDHIPTPCLLLDEAALNRNLARMSRRALDAGVDLRPHCKTAKCLEVALRATAGHSGAIAVATMREAEFFAANGFSDILYTVNLEPSKIERIAPLQEAGARVSAVLDSAAAAHAIAAAQHRLAGPLEIFLELDSGTHRTGFLPGDSEILEAARILEAAPKLALRGTLAFGGKGYAADRVEGTRAAAEAERRAATDAAEAIRAAGIACPDVSIGSTPTRTLGDSLEGVTEIRPGVYVFMDLMQVKLHVCEYSDIAVTVLARVIAHNRRENRIYIDAGALALSNDPGIRPADGPYAPYGLLRDPETGGPISGLGVFNVNQEHGFVQCADPEAPFPFDDFPLGAPVRVFPNHICHTAGSHDRYHVIGPDGSLIGEWKRVTGW